VLHTNHNLAIALTFPLSILILGLMMPPPQLFAITICNASINLSSCGDESSSASISSDSETPDRPQSGNTETTPLIVPDVSPRDEDLGSAVTDGDQDTTDAIADANNDDNGDDNSENDADGNVDVDRQDDKDSGNDGDESGNEGPFLLPFP
jgi:hypothetical protein